MRRKGDEKVDQNPFPTVFAQFCSWSAAARLTNWSKFSFSGGEKERNLEGSAIVIVSWTELPLDMTRQPAASERLGPELAMSFIGPDSLILEISSSTCFGSLPRSSLFFNLLYPSLKRVPLSTELSKNFAARLHLRELPSRGIQKGFSRNLDPNNLAYKLQ